MTAPAEMRPAHVASGVAILPLGLERSRRLASLITLGRGLRASASFSVDGIADGLGASSPPGSSALPPNLRQRRAAYRPGNKLPPDLGRAPGRVFSPAERKEHADEADTRPGPAAGGACRCR